MFQGSHVSRVSLHAREGEREGLEGEREGLMFERERERGSCFEGLLDDARGLDHEPP
jgi:hypothetical protein